MEQNNGNPVVRPKKNPVAKELVLGVAATLMSFLPVLVIPVVGVFFSVFTPLPTLVSFYRLGRPLGFVIPAGAAVVAGLILFYLDAPNGMYYFLEMLLLGLLLAVGMRQRLSIEKTVAGATLFVFGLSSLVFWYAQGGAGGEVFQELENDLKASITMLIQQHPSLSANQAELAGTVEKVASILVRLLPGITLASTLIVAWLNLLVAMRFCRYQRAPLPPWPNWSQWKAPEHLVWVVIAAGFMLLLPLASFKILALNGLIALGVVYLLQGLAIVVYYFDRWRLPKILRVFFYSLLILQQFATLGVVVLGFFDMWFDFRRISAKSAGV